MSQHKKDTDCLTYRMEMLYDSEINCGVETFWDSGFFTVWLGDEMNGRREAGAVEIGDTAGLSRWLHEAALRHFPNSEYAKKYGEAA